MVVANEQSSGFKSSKPLMDIAATDTTSSKIEPTDQPKQDRTVSTQSALDTVDEEPTNEVKQKSKVDRGVVPTLLPPTSLPLHIPQLLPTNTLDQAAYHQSLAYYAAQSAVSNMSPLGYSAGAAAPPLLYPPGQPLSSNTNDGRYYFNTAFHRASPVRLAGSPTQSDVSLISNPSIPGSVDRLAAQLHWEHYQRQLQQMQSPYKLACALTAAQRLAYLAESSKRSMFSEIPATPGSGSITLPPSLNSSRLTSPRPSLVGGKGRKRALSHSPLSEFLDIQSLTRSSEGSLHLTPLLHNPNSRSSSVASGSYGHLSAGPYLQAAAAASLYPSLQLPFSLPFASPAASQPLIPPASMALKSTVKQELVSPSQVFSFSRDKGGGSEVVSSTVPGIGEDQTDTAFNVKGEAEESQDFKETVCRWVNCTQEFLQHEDLVTHVNQDHIGANKKTFICKWAECCRQEKPFKAQYMLVVHMRRHTGEKPHRCQGFPGCNKAYSRLENLKTHMRSHTGERPYLCEFPGCQKAFSNASDRAKHQNRTHSNAKPYACEIDGCSKRYTDPSSLRKHVKTVHGAEFYARKKHKGLDTPGCRANTSTTTSGEKKDDEKNKKVEACLTVTGLASGERQTSQENIVIGEQSSPQSDTDVEINVLRSENINLLPTAGITNSLNTVDEVVEEEVLSGGQEETNGSSILMRQALQPRTANLKTKLTTKSSPLSALPSLPTMPPGTLRKKVSNKDPLIGHQVATSSMKNRKLPEIIEPVAIPGQQFNGPRRDSNTSTLSSYMSSLRSDASPAIFNSRFSSRRSSEASQNSARLSIINSPYEYDLTGNIPERHSHDLIAMTDQMEKARLGSQPNLYLQSQALSLQSPLIRRDQVRRDHRRVELDGWRTATPSHTPLPHEYPQYEKRRASDPVRCADPNFSELRKLQHRFYSLNAVKPLPIPANMKSLSSRHPSHETFQSSQSSIATNPMACGFDGPDFEASLDMKMIEDNEDVIIPDDMRQFLQQRQVNRLNNSRNRTLGSHSNSIDEWIQQTNINHQTFDASRLRDAQTISYGTVHNGYQCENPTPPPPPYNQHYVMEHHMCGRPTYMQNGFSNGHHCCGMRQQSCCHPSYPSDSHHCGTAPYNCLSQPNPGCYHNNNSYSQYQAVHGNFTQHSMPLNMVGAEHNSRQNHQPTTNINPGNNKTNYSSSSATATNGRHNRGYHGSQPIKQPITLQQQLSPPCEVTSSTDPCPQALPGAPTAVVHDDLNAYENILDNISSISAELHSLASQNISSVSQIKQSVDDGNNMVINNMSNVLLQFTEENKYLNSHPI